MQQFHAATGGNVFSSAADCAANEIPSLAFTFGVKKRNSDIRIKHKMTLTLIAHTAFSIFESQNRHSGAASLYKRAFCDFVAYLSKPSRCKHSF